MTTLRTRIDVNTLKAGSLNALLIDDEESSLNRLVHLLKRNLPTFHVVDSVASASEGRKVMMEKPVDLIFLDVEMPGEDGFTFLESIDDQNVLVVFVTAYDRYAIRAFQANAVDYLVKPVQAKDLLQTAKRLREKRIAFERASSSWGQYSSSLKRLREDAQTNEFPAQLMINHLNGFSLVKTSEVTHLESANYCTVFHLSNGKSIVSSRGLTTFEKLLDPTQFFRVHRSAMINLHYLCGTSSEEGYYALLSTGQKIEVSRRRRDDFVSHVKLWL